MLEDELKTFSPAVAASGEDFNSAAIGGVLDRAPGIPFAFPSVVVSNVFCSLLKTLCSGSTISSVSSDKVKSSSRLICAETLPAPTIGVTIDTTLLR